MRFWQALLVQALLTQVKQQPRGSLHPDTVTCECQCSCPSTGESSSTTTTTTTTSSSTTSSSPSGGSGQLLVWCGVVAQAGFSVVFGYVGSWAARRRLPLRPPLVEATVLPAYTKFNLEDSPLKVTPPTTLEAPASPSTSGRGGPVRPSDLLN